MKAVDAIRDWWLTNARIRHGHPPGAPTASARPGGLAEIALGLAAMAASGGLGFAASQWATSAPRAPGQAVAVAPPQETERSLYQYLEDNGFHLPE